MPLVVSRPCTAVALPPLRCFVQCLARQVAVGETCWVGGSLVWCWFVWSVESREESLMRGSAHARCAAAVRAVATEQHRKWSCNSGRRVCDLGNSACTQRRTQRKKTTTLELASEVRASVRQAHPTHPVLHHRHYGSTPSSAPPQQRPSLYIRTVAPITITAVAVAVTVSGIHTMCIMRCRSTIAGPTHTVPQQPRVFVVLRCTRDILSSSS